MTIDDTTGNGQSHDLPWHDNTRRDGWTNERQLAFLNALSEGGNVARAAASVGMSASSAYRLRGRLEGDIFGYGWKAAEAMAYVRMRDIMMDRIDHGVPTPSTYRGEVIATKTVFSDRLLIAMLNHLKPAEGTLGPTGLRRPAADPGRDFAATIEAYHAGIDGGFDPATPVTPDGCVNGCKPQKTMTRAEFIAAIRMRPKLEPVGPEWGDPPATGEIDAEDCPAEAGAAPGEAASRDEISSVAAAPDVDSSDARPAWRAAATAPAGSAEAPDTHVAGVNFA